MLYPTFESSGGAQTIKAAPLIKIKFMNWAQNSQTRSGLLGACGGFTFSPTMEPGVFTTREKGGTNVIYPKEVMIETSLTIIHEHPLGWKKAEETLYPTPGEPPAFKSAVLSWIEPQANHFPYGEAVGKGLVNINNIKQVDVTNPDYVEEDLSNITKDIPAEKLKSQQEAKVERMAPKGSAAWAKARYKKLGAAAYGSKPAPVRSSAPTFGSGRGPAVP